MSDAFAMLKDIKETGRKVVGFYCVYAPQELVVAAGALGFSLCATKEEGIPDGEKFLPRNFCPLIKSSYGLAVTDKCPYFLYADLIIGETTCDGKKKMFELMKNFKPVHVMKMPQSYLDENDKAYWLSEVKRLKEFLEAELNTAITDEKLQQAIQVLNEERQLMQQLAEFMKNDPVPMTGQDFLKLLWGRNFVTDRNEFVEQVKAVISDLEDSVAQGEAARPKGARRVLVTGVPTGIGAEKVIRIIEDCGAVVVYLENCSGMKQYVTLVDETKPPLEAIAEKYLATPCSCMSPNPTRLENLAQLVTDYRVDGVVDITWQGCHTYNVESRVVKEFLKKNGDTPFLQVETDYSQGDVEQIKTRVQAFLEMMG